MKIPDHLETRLRDGRVIPFVGAGVSMAVERKAGGRLFPSWKELLLAGADALERQGKNAAAVRGVLEDDEPEYLFAAKKLRSKLGPRWAAFLKDAIDVARAEVDDASLALARAVWGLGCRLLITTNYDKVLRWACPKELRDDLKTWDIEAPAEQAEYLQTGAARASTVWHLHGQIDNAAGLVLTPDGYAQLYPSTGEPEGRHAAALETLRNLLASHSFLFVGFSLDDAHFGYELDRLLETFDGYGGPHYALVHQRHAERLRDKPVEVILFEDYGEPLLKLLGELAQCCEPVQDDVGPVDVYLADVADSRRRLRQRIHDDLVRERVRVAWNVPPPYPAAEHHGHVTSLLRRARLSVHLLDGFAGREIDGSPETTYLREQVRLAREHAREQLVWLPRQLGEVEEGQAALLEELRNASGLDFLDGTPPSELVADILDKLRQDAPLPEEPDAVLLHGHARDTHLVEEVEAFLQEHEVETYIHIHRPQGDRHRETRRLVARLRSVGAVVLCHGAAETSWVTAQVAEAFRASFRELFKMCCVYVVPPADADLEPYARFDVLEDIGRFALLRSPRATPEATTFAPLFKSLGIGGER